MKRLPWIVFCGGILALVVVLHEQRSRQRAERALSEWEAKRSQALAEFERIHATATEAERDERDLRLALERVTAARGIGAPPPTSAPVGQVTPLDVIARDPQLQAMYLATRRRTFVNAYTPLLRTLKLTPEQTTQFFDLLLAYEERANDVLFAARAQGLPQNDPAVAKLRAEAWTALRASQETLLGPAAAQVRDYDRTLGARAVVERFVGASTLSEIPLTLDQANAMVAVIVGQSSKFQKGGDSEISTVDWKAVDRNLRGVLTPEQLALFQTTEPISGGASRWVGQLSEALEKAKAEDRARPSNPPAPSSRG